MEFTRFFESDGLTITVFLGMILIVWKSLSSMCEEYKLATAKEKFTKHYIRRKNR